MKKSLAVLLALVMVAALAACSQQETKPAATSADLVPNTTTPATNDTPKTDEAPKTDTEPAPADKPVMSHAEYAAAELDTEVKVETYVQAHQSWWDNQVTIYAQSPDGAYFIYNAACSEEDAAKLVPGTKIVVEGVKSEWAGEVEIVDATFTFAEGDSFIAEAKEVSELLGLDELAEHQNEYVAFRGMTVEPYDETGAAFAYKNAENKTDDLYFKVSKDGAVYEFTVEYYLCGNDTEVYKAVEALKVGETVDLEGFLYWYNGANPHITSLTVTSMSHADYIAAELDSEVKIETYVQATQSWWDNKLTIYAQSPDGAYFIYNANCDEATANFLVPGTKIRVTGYKSEWAGEVEIVDATIEPFSNGYYLAEATDVTDLLGTDALVEHQNELVAFKGMTVEAYDETGAAFAYKNAENKTDDLYFKVSKDGVVYDFCVEYYLCGSDTEVYKAVEALEVGQVVDLEGFLYWYEGANPHITSVVVK